MLLDECLWSAPLPGSISARATSAETIIIHQDHKSAPSERWWTMELYDHIQEMTTLIVGTIEREVLIGSLADFGLGDDFDGWQVGAGAML